jgi:hypothetical protein
LQGPHTNSRYQRSQQHQGEAQAQFFAIPRLAKRRCTAEIIALNPLAMADAMKPGYKK